MQFVNNLASGYQKSIKSVSRAGEGGVAGKNHLPSAAPAAT